MCGDWAQGSGVWTGTTQIVFQDVGTLPRLLKMCRKTSQSSSAQSLSSLGLILLGPEAFLTSDLLTHTKLLKELFGIYQGVVLGSSLSPDILMDEATF